MCSTMALVATRRRSPQILGSGLRGLKRFSAELQERKDEAACCADPAR